MEPSPHYLTFAAQVVSFGAVVRRGVVEEEGTHQALVRWSDGDEEEVEQLDPRVWVETRRNVPEA